MADIVMLAREIEIELDLHPELPKQKVRLDVIFVDAKEFDKALDRYYDDHGLTIAEMKAFEKVVRDKAVKQLEKKVTEVLYKLKEEKTNA